MSYIHDEIADALTELETDCGDSDGAQAFTWKTAEIPCVPDTLLRGTEVVIGGKEWTVQFSLTVRKSHFLSADSSLITVDSDQWTGDDVKPHPIAGRKLTFRGKVYRILSVSEDPTRAYAKLNLADSNSGR
jgi:hypothetical protein